MVTYSLIILLFPTLAQLFVSRVKSNVMGIRTDQGSRTDEAVISYLGMGPDLGLGLDLTPIPDLGTGFDDRERSNFYGFTEFCGFGHDSGGMDFCHRNDIFHNNPLSRKL